jgi:IS30 family transposase
VSTIQSKPTTRRTFAVMRVNIKQFGKDSIYRFISSIYGRKIEYERSKKVQKIEDRVFIDKRPEYINERKRLGDAEADFIVSGKSGKGILLTLVDRKTRVSFIKQILEVSIQNVEKAFKCIKKRFPELRTITTDNDILFRHHKRLEKLISMRIYFCHPYHSWEKGSIENTNKHIRKDIPKGSDISKYDKPFIRSVEKKLNRRFMEVLHHETPEEALARLRKRKSTTTSRKEGVRIEGL